MAIRPVFVVSTDKKFVKKENIEFKFFNGFSAVQKKEVLITYIMSIYVIIKGKRYSRFQVNQIMILG